MQDIHLPSEALSHFKNSIGFDAAAFAAAHTSFVPVCIRQNLKKVAIIDDSMSSVPWCPNAFYLKQRPNFSQNPLWHAGTYYVQEASSMFLHHICRQLHSNNIPIAVLDACAAPGGKSTLLTDALPEGSLLISNEVVPKRAGILYENMEKWGRISTMVTHADIKQFAQLSFKFDTVVVDAPCTGSGLWRKQPDSIAEWSLSAVETCAARQKQIIQDIWPSLKPGGYLIYSTCSYSANENEDILDYLADSLQALPVAINYNVEWGITSCASSKKAMPCYRFYPYNLMGEGFFIAVVQKPVENNEYVESHLSDIKMDKESRGKSSHLILPDNISQHQLQPHRFWALPKRWEALMYMLYKKLPVKKMGILLGEFKGLDFIPEHGFAMSELITQAHAHYFDVDLETALRYLRKETQWFDDMPDGWNIISYKNMPLGWVKKAATRINNYYPPAWRLRS